MPYLDEHVDSLTELLQLLNLFLQPLHMLMQVIQHLQHNDALAEQSKTIPNVIRTLLSFKLLTFACKTHRRTYIIKYVNTKFLAAQKSLKQTLENTVGLLLWSRVCLNAIFIIQACVPQPRVTESCWSIRTSVRSRAFASRSSISRRFFSTSDTTEATYDSISVRSLLSPAGQLLFTHKTWQKLINLPLIAGIDPDSGTYAGPCCSRTPPDAIKLFCCKFLYDSARFPAVLFLSPSVITHLLDCLRLVSMVTLNNGLERAI